MQRWGRSGSLRHKAFTSDHEIYRDITKWWFWEELRNVLHETWAWIARTPFGGTSSWEDDSTMKFMGFSEIALYSFLDGDWKVAVVPPPPLQNMIGSKSDRPPNLRLKNVQKFFETTTRLWMQHNKTCQDNLNIKMYKCKKCLFLSGFCNRLRLETKDKQPFSNAFPKKALTKPHETTVHALHETYSNQLLAWHMNIHRSFQEVAPTANLGPPTPLTALPSSLS